MSIFLSVVNTMLLTACVLVGIYILTIKNQEIRKLERDNSKLIVHRDGLLKSQSLLQAKLESREYLHNAIKDSRIEELESELAHKEILLAQNWKNAVRHNEQQEG